MMVLRTSLETSQHRVMTLEGTTLESRILSKEGGKINSGNRGDVAKNPPSF